MKPSVSMLFALLLLCLASPKAEANDEKIKALLKHFYAHDYAPGHCYANIGEIAEDLLKLNLVSSNETSVVIVENSANNLTLGTDARTNEFHVFLIAGKMVIDPLLIELEMNEDGVATDIARYLGDMFPDLKGVKFTALPAQLYVSLEEETLVRMLFSYYQTRAGVALGERRLGQNGLPPDDFNGLWRLPLMPFGRALGFF